MLTEQRLVTRLCQSVAVGRFYYYWLQRLPETEGFVNVLTGNKPTNTLSRVV